MKAFTLTNISLFNQNHLKLNIKAWESGAEAAELWGRLSWSWTNIWPAVCQNTGTLLTGLRFIEKFKVSPQLFCWSLCSSWENLHVFSCYHVWQLPTASAAETFMWPWANAAETWLNGAAVSSQPRRSSTHVAVTSGPICLCLCPRCENTHSCPGDAARP